MHVYNALEEFIPSSKPLTLTIGNFDGMHLGHQSLLDKLKEVAGPFGETAILTFENHPSHVLRPSKPTCLLCSYSQRLKLIEAFKINYLFALPFTKKFAEQSAEEFIDYLKTYVPFSHLVLGFNATIGNKRKGDQSTLQAISRDKNFSLTYADEFLFNNITVSSSTIRSHLLTGNLKAVEQFLARPYSIIAPVVEGSRNGKMLGFPTANLKVEGLCLPPFGVYCVDVIKNGIHFKAIANLGVAPTIQIEREPLLEVHLLTDTSEVFYHETIEVIFKRFIRPEIRFSSREALQMQIQRDIEQCS